MTASLKLQCPEIIFLCMSNANIKGFRNKVFFFCIAGLFLAGLQARLLLENLYSSIFICGVRMDLIATRAHMIALLC